MGNTGNLEQIGNRLISQESVVLWGNLSWCNSAGFLLDWQAVISL